MSQDLKDALQNKDTHTDELTELQEAVEMATLDKEMAEEKVGYMSLIMYILFHYQDETYKLYIVKGFCCSFCCLLHISFLLK